ncbi:MAG: TetR/AcrR family transcriptional regulator [Acetobacteraceae bacterium]|jgi:AcrR family transcriptional regulator
MIAPPAKTASTRRAGDLPPRERILAAARALFYRRGIHVVGVDAIAEAAGTNKMTLYRHFASKDILIAACLRELTREFDTTWETIAAAHVGDPKGQLLAWLRHVCDFKENEADRGCALANAAVELPDKDHPARQVIRETKSAHRERLVSLCREAGLTDPEGLSDEIQLLWEGARVTAQSVGPEGLSARLIGMLEALVAAHAPRGERNDPHSQAAEGRLVASDAAR